VCAVLMIVSAVVSVSTGRVSGMANSAAHQQIFIKKSG
jgi:hypothetical protein